jgi:ACS family D-galactonate transporter-like MFS transporter
VWPFVRVIHSHTVGTAPSLTPPATRATRFEWLILALLVVSVALSYVDRGNLSVTGVAISRELHLKPHELGFLLSGFFWTYSVSLVISGWLIDRYNVMVIVAVGFVIWSGATAVTGLANGFATLFVLRLVLGVSESVAYPAYSKIIASTFHEHQRGMANALIDVGCRFGPAIGLVAGGLILERFGWRPVFLWIGLASLVWVIPWCILAPKIHVVSLPHVRYSGPSFVDILCKREAWGTLAGLFCANYAWYFMLTWLPQYLLLERHYSTHLMALTGWLPFCATAAGAATGGWLSDRWISRGASPTRVRKTFAVAGLAGSAVCLLPAAVIDDQFLAMSLLVLAGFVYGLFSSNLWAITQTLAGAVAAGKWTGIQNGVGNMAGIVAPVVTGFIVEATGKFYLAFVLVCVLLVAGALSYLLVVRKVEPVEWGEATGSSELQAAVSKAI